MAIKLVIFDEDGTLVDTAPGSIECFRKTGALLGKEELPESVLRSALCGPFDKNVTRIFNLDYEGMLKAVDIYVNLYAKQEGYLKFAEYPGLNDAVRELSGRYRLGVATMMLEAFSEKIVSRMGIRDCFTVLKGSDMNIAYVKKDLIEFCLKEVGCEASEAVMVGDSMDDYESAKAAGLGFIGVTWGYGLKPADCEKIGIKYAETPSQLTELL